MTYNRTALAFGLIVGIALVAGILRIRFYFDPPEDRFTKRWQEVLQTDPILDSQPVTSSTDLTETTVIPQTSTAVQFTSAQTIELTSGIPLTTLSTETGTIVVVLRGSDLFMIPYDLNWVAGTEQLLRNHLELVNGQPPLTKLVPTASGYTLLQTQPTSELLIQQYDQAWVAGQSLTIAAQPSALAANAETAWLWGNSKLQVFNLMAGTLVAEADQFDVVPPCSALLDQASVIQLQAADGISLQKVDAFGTAEPVIHVTATSLIGACAGAARQAAIIAVLMPETIELFNDNFTWQYPAIPRQTGQLFAQLGLQADTLWLLYSQSEQLGDYTMRVATYQLVPAAD